MYTLKKTYSVLFLTLLACLYNVHADDKNTEAKDFQKVSKAFGHIIAKNLQSLGSDFDTKSILSGIEDSLNGKPSPMTEEETMQAVAAKQEESFKLESEKNLKEAEAFLKKNKD